LRLGDHAGAEAAAAEVVHLSDTRDRDLHLAASLLAQCVPLAEKDAALGAGARRTADGYAETAVGYLRRADPRKARPRTPLDRDRDFAPLWDRTDFRKEVEHWKSALRSP